MGEGGCGDAAILPPGAAVEETGERGQQDVAPVEVQRPFVEVGEAEEQRGDEERRGAAEAALEQVLQPAAEEELLRDGDEEEGEEEHSSKLERVRPERRDGVQVQEAERETKDEGDRRVEGELAQADAEVAEAEAQIEADAVEAAQQEEAIDAGVEQQDLVEDGEVRGPGGFEPAQVDGEAEQGQDEEVAPGAALGGIGAAGVEQQGRDGDREQDIEEEPAPAQVAGGEGDEGVGERQESRRQDAAQAGRRSMRAARRSQVVRQNAASSSGSSMSRAASTVAGERNGAMWDMLLLRYPGSCSPARRGVKGGVGRGRAACLPQTAAGPVRRGA